MKFGPCYAEVVTWKTGADRGQGLTGIHESLAYGENVGHASLDIAFPYTEETERWVQEYCKNLALYETSGEIIKDDDEAYVANVPTYYTTRDGIRIDDPKEYHTLHPDAEILTHVYLSWVPTGYAAQRDDRDPFHGVWKCGFNLYTHDQDKLNERAGEGFPWRRGYDVVREIEFRSEGDIQHTAEYIERGAGKIIHNLTPDEARYYSFTPGDRAYFKSVEDIYLSITEDKQDPLVSLESVQAKLATKHGDENSFSKLYTELIDTTEWVTDFFELYKEQYARENNIDLSKCTEEELKRHRAIIVDGFIEQGLNAQIEKLKERIGDIKIYSEERIIQRYVLLQEKIEKVEGSLQGLRENSKAIMKNFSEYNKAVEENELAMNHFSDELEKNQKKLENLLSRLTTPENETQFRLLNRKREETVQNINNIQAQMKVLEMRLEEAKEARKGEKNKILKENPAINFFLETNPDVNTMSTSKYLSKYLRKDILNYIQFKEKYGALLNDRIMRTQVGLREDMRIMLPIGAIPEIGYQGQSDGLDVKKMLRAISDSVVSGEGYDLNANNCSDLVQKICFAGVPSQFKKEFSRHAAGIAATPQMVSNSALRYAKTLNNPNYQAGKYKLNYFRSWMLGQEEKTSQINAAKARLNEKIGVQDKIIDLIIEEKENCKNTDVFGKLAHAIYAALPDDVKNSTDDNKMREAIFEFCDEKYRANIKEDQERLRADILNQAGLFKHIAERDEKPLSDEAIQAEMTLWYSKIYGNKPLIGKNKKIKEDFSSKGALYMHACHSILFRHAPGTENLMDPNYTSMKEERAELSRLKSQAGRNLLGLITMRMVGSMFGMYKPGNVSDPWYEFKFVAKNTKLFLDEQYGKEPSFKKGVATVGRYALLGIIGGVQGVLVAPFRAVRNRNRSLDSGRSKKTLAKASKKEQLIDLRFAYKTGEFTEEQLIKKEMHKNLLSNMNTWEHFATTRKKIDRKIDREYSQKSPLYHYAKAIVGITPEMEEERRATMDNQTAMNKADMNVVKIRKKQSQKAILAFNSALSDGKIPQFSEFNERHILARSQRVENILSNQEKQDSRLLSKQLDKKLQQFKLIQMWSIGKWKRDDFASHHQYNPKKAGEIVPEHVKNTTDPEVIRRFLKERNKSNESHDEDEYEHKKHLFFTEAELDKLSAKQLFEINRQLCFPTYNDILRDFEHNIIQKCTSNPEFSLLKLSAFDVDAFKVFLQSEGLSTKVITLLEENNALVDFKIRLQYEECSAKAMVAIQRETASSKPKLTELNRKWMKRFVDGNKVEQKKEDSAPSTSWVAGRPTQKR